MKTANTVSTVTHLAHVIKDLELLLVVAVELHQVSKAQPIHQGVRRNGALEGTAVEWQRVVLEINAMGAGWSGRE
jgi:hypothetical protein